MLHPICVISNVKFIEALAFTSILKCMHHSPSITAMPEGVVGGEAEVGEQSSECGRLA